MKNKYKANSKTDLTEVKKTPLQGYGHCHSCDCKGYISKHNDSHECKNCGHHYDRHN